MVEISSSKKLNIGYIFGLEFINSMNGRAFITKIKDKIINQTALRKAGKPSDITSAVIFLVKDSPYITGQIIAVDGGRSIGW